MSGAYKGGALFYDVKVRFFRVRKKGRFFKIVLKIYFPVLGAEDDAPVSKMGADSPSPDGKGTANQEGRTAGSHGPVSM